MTSISNNRPYSETGTIFGEKVSEKNLVPIPVPENPDNTQSPSEKAEVNKPGSGDADSSMNLGLDENDLEIEITDRDGLATDSANDLEIKVNGKVDLEKKIAIEGSGINPNDLSLETSADKKSITISYDTGIPLVGKADIKLGLKEVNGQMAISIKPDLLVSNFAGGFSNAQDIEKTFGLPAGSVKKDPATGEYIVKVVDLLKNQYPDGLPVAGKKINLNEIKPEGITFNNVSLKDGKLDLGFDFNNATINGGTGTKATSADSSKEQKAKIKLDLDKVNLDQVDSDVFNKGNIEIPNFKKVVEDALKSAGIDGNVEVKDNQMVINGRLGGIIPFQIPVHVEGTKIRMDLSQLTSSGFLNEYVAEVFSRELYNGTAKGGEGLTSKIEGDQLIIDLNSAIPSDLKAKIDNISIKNDGSVSIDFSKGTIDNTERVNNKVNMIDNLFDGYTSGKDEQTIKKILINSNPEEISSVLDKISIERLEDELDDGDLAEVMQKLAENPDKGNNLAHLKKIMSVVDDDTTMLFLEKVNDQQLKEISNSPEGKQLLQKAWDNLDSGWTTGGEEKQMERIKRVMN